MDNYKELIERLYKHHSDYGEGRTQNFFSVCLDCEKAAKALAALTDENARLHAYEDTGLEPDTISKIRDIVLDISGDIDHLRELVQTEKDGRLVDYLPEDTVYDRFGMAWTVTSTEIYQFDGRCRYLYRCGHPGTNDYRALYDDEILTREEAEAALMEEKL